MDHGFGILAAVLATLAAPAVAAPIALPSGHSVTFHDVIWGELGTSGLTVRFRFLDPALAAREGPAGRIDATDDTQFLCEDFALEQVARAETPPDQIVISISDRPVDFGEPAPDVTQIFEAYTLENGTCQWDMF